MSAKNPAVIYCRISRDADGDGIGVERQEKLCREHAEKRGLQVVEVYTDNDIGASNRTGNKLRPQYQRMLADARAGKIGTIIAYSASRLTRRPVEWVGIIEIAEDVPFYVSTITSGEYDLKRADQKAILLTLAAWDAAESDRISERQKAAFRDNAYSGKPKLQRQRAFGWDDDGVTIRESEAKLIREGVKKLSLGSSITAIAREWEKAGVLTAAGNSKWEHSVLKRVLTGWRTAGVRTYKREPLRDAEGNYVQGTWTPIISLEERQIALGALEKHSRKKVRQGSWLLSGLLYCGECGGRMYGQLPSGTRTRSMYACRTGHVSISAFNLENQIMASYASRMLSKILRDQTPPRDDTISEAKDWPKQDELDRLNELNKKLRTSLHEGTVEFELAVTLLHENDDLRRVLERERVDFYREQSASVVEMNYREIEAFVGSEYAIYPTEVHDENGELVAFEDPKRAEKLLLLHRELKMVKIKKGKRGRANRGMHSLAERLEFVWND